MDIEMRNLVAKIVVPALLALGCAVSPAAAAVVFSENFNNSGFIGTVLAGGSDTSDRYDPTTYYFINNFAGWSFNSSNTFLAVGGNNDGAVLLNENGGNSSAAVTIGGLVSGKSYTVNFLLSGDNRPGSAYVLNASVDGGPATTFNGVDGAAGSSLGTLSSFAFIAGGSTASLVFTQASANEASPIIDNISVNSAVPEPATWGLLIVGFGMVGVTARRRKAALAA
jgi:hypothetical protein